MVNGLSDTAEFLVFSSRLVEPLRRVGQSAGASPLSFLYTDYRYRHRYPYDRSLRASPTDIDLQVLRGATNSRRTLKSQSIELNRNSIRI